MSHPDQAPFRSSAPLDAKAGAKEALVAAGVLLLAFTIGKPLAHAAGSFDKWVYTLLVGFQLYVPLWLIQRQGEMPESHAIHAHGFFLGPLAFLRARLVRRRRRQRRRSFLPNSFFSVLAHYGRRARFQPRAFAADIGRAFAFSAVTFPLFAVAHHLWQTRVMHLHERTTWTMPNGLAMDALQQVFLVALPEEMFYRGFLETRLDRWLPTKTYLWIVPLSRTVVLSAALFALGHFLGEWNFARLAPFFPAFLFSALTRKSGSIAGAVVFHGMSNVFSKMLIAGYGR